MNIELRNIQHYPKLSQETNAFSADIWIDGKKAGACHDDGNGGEVLYHFSLAEISLAACDWAASLPPVSSFGMSIKMDLSSYLANLAEKDLSRRQVARWCKTATVFRLKGQAEGEYQKMARTPFTPAVKEYLVKKYGKDLESILNETM